MWQQNCKQIGSYHILMSLMLVPLIGAIAIAVDGFQGMAANFQQDNSVEYAALAAVKELRANSHATFVVRTTQASLKAAKVAGANTYLGTNNANQMPGNMFQGKYGSIKFGVVRANSLEFLECVNDADYARLKASDTYDAVRVMLKTNSDTAVISTFARLIGFSKSESSNTVISFFDEGSNLYKISR